MQGEVKGILTLIFSWFLKGTKMNFVLLQIKVHVRHHLHFLLGAFSKAACFYDLYYI